MADVVTLRWYNRLPESYRTDDVAQGLALLGYLSLLGDQASDIEDLQDRIDYVPGYDGGVPGDVSALVDPATANAGWLDWLAAALGTDRGDLDDAGLRIFLADIDREVGTGAALQAAARGTLNGTRTVYYAAGQGPKPWGIVVQTLTAETPDPDATERAVRAHKPAGHRLTVINAASRVIDVLQGTINEQIGTINNL